MSCHYIVTLCSRLYSDSADRALDSMLDLINPEAHSISRRTMIIQFWCEYRIDRIVEDVLVHDETTREAVKLS